MSNSIPEIIPQTLKLFFDLEKASPPILEKLPLAERANLYFNIFTTLEKQEKKAFSKNKKTLFTVPNLIQIAIQNTPFEHDLELKEKWKNTLIKYISDSIAKNPPEILDKTFVLFEILAKDNGLNLCSSEKANLFLKFFQKRLDFALNPDKDEFKKALNIFSSQKIISIEDPLILNKWSSAVLKTLKKLSEDPINISQIIFLLTNFISWDQLPKACNKKELADCINNAVQFIKSKINTSALMENYFQFINFLTNPKIAASLFLDTKTTTQITISPFDIVNNLISEANSLKISKKAKPALNLFKTIEQKNLSLITNHLDLSIDCLFLLGDSLLKTSKDIECVKGLITPYQKLQCFKELTDEQYDNFCNIAEKALLMDTDLSFDSYNSLYYEFFKKFEPANKPKIHIATTRFLELSLDKYIKILESKRDLAYFILIIRLWFDLEGHAQGRENFLSYFKKTKKILDICNDIFPIDQKYAFVNLKEYPNIELFHNLLIQTGFINVLNTWSTRTKKHIIISKFENNETAFTTPYHLINQISHCQNQNYHEYVRSIFAKIQAVNPLLEFEFHDK